MPVQDFSGRGQDAVRKKGKYPARESGISPGMRALLGGLRIAIIREGPLRGAELVLERNQAFVAAVGAPEIKACRARGLAFLDELPEKKRHASELVKGSVRASVFVNDVGAVPQGEK